MQKLILATLVSVLMTLVLASNTFAQNRAIDWETYSGNQKFDPNNPNAQQGMQRDTWYSFEAGFLVATIHLWENRMMRINVYRDGTIELREYCRGNRENIVSNVMVINVYERRAPPTIIECDGGAFHSSTSTRKARQHFIDALLERIPLVSKQPPRVMALFAELVLERYALSRLRHDPRDYRDRFDEEYDYRRPESRDPRDRQ